VAVDKLELVLGPVAEECCKPLLAAGLSRVVAGALGAKMATESSEGDSPHVVQHDHQDHQNEAMTTAYVYCMPER
jgi:hypothetical protein